MATPIVRVTRFGAVLAALLLAVPLVGDAFAGGEGITEPQVLELVTMGCATNDDDPSTHCRTYRLKDTDGHRSGDIGRFKVPLSDVDGNPVGNGFTECMTAKSTGQICSFVLVLKDGPHTQAGSIVATGIGLPPSAITGGSGAYLNVRGDITGEGQADGFHLFLNLIP